MMSLRSANSLFKKIRCQTLNDEYFFVSKILVIRIEGSDGCSAGRGDDDFFHGLLLFRVARYGFFDCEF